ncbi:MAG: ABC transporter ATP-binding protein, partial [Sorangiineae bacterium PRO1]|nr:ABC transporter ATP-binding protein [Sorangiineae bacterium PRO1]
ADGAVVTVRGDRARAVSLLEALPGVRRVKARKGDDAELSRVTLTLAKGESNVGAVLEAAVGALCAAGLGVREAGPSRATLEDVFAELTRDEADAAAEQETEE